MSAGDNEPDGFSDPESPLAPPEDTRPLETDDDNPLDPSDTTGPHVGDATVSDFSHPSRP